MKPEQIVAVIFAMNLVSYTLLLRWWVWPRVTARPLVEGLAPLVAFHFIRTLGLFALVPGMAGEYAAASRWAHHVAVGDAVTVALAWITVALLRRRHRWSLAATWAFNLWGSLDCLNAGVNAAGERILENGVHAQGIVIGFGVPALVVTHAAIFVLLVRAKYREGS